MIERREGGKVEGPRSGEIGNIEADMIEHDGYSPNALTNASAVSVPEKFCWPVSRLPSRT